MATLDKPYVQINYEDANISEDISLYLTEFSYTDHVHGKADEVELTLDDKSGLFQNAWYPDKRAKITCQIQQQGQTLYCGTFFIDEVGFSGAPDTIKWHATSIDPSAKLRTKKSKGYNQVSLLQIAKDIAGNYNLTLDDGTKSITLKNPPTTDEQAKLVKLASLFLSGSNEKNTTFFYTIMSNLMQQLLTVIVSLENKGYTDEGKQLRDGVGNFLLDKTGEAAVVDDVTKKRLGASKMSQLCTQVKETLRLKPLTQTKVLGLGLQTIFIERSTQNYESDLQYLKRISSQYGLAFNIKPPSLVFYSVFQLEDAPAVATIDKTSVTSFDFTDKLHDTYADVDVSSHNPNTNETVSGATVLENTLTEQIKLASLYGYMSQAALQNDYGTRLAFIRKAHENNDAVLKGLIQKGFSDQYTSLLNAYAALFDDKSITACIRYANFCKDLRTQLLKIQAQGNKVTKDKDTYAGGQSADVLTVRTRAENTDQANAIGKAALHAKNSKTRTGNFTVPGNLLLVAGNNFNLTGFGALSGKYACVSTTHTVAADYTTSVEFKAGAVTA